MNNKLIKSIIMEAETYREYKYLCSKGVPTIAIGRTFITEDEATMLFEEDSIIFNMGFKDLESISFEDSLILLDNDIKRCTLELQRELSYFAMLPSEVQVVLVDMCFNMGIKRLTKFKNMFRCIGSGDYSKASIELLDSNYASDVKGRALRNSIALSTGKFVDLEVCKLMWKQLKGRV